MAFRWICAVLGAATSLFTGCDAVGERVFEFALVGDNPYPAENVVKFERLIEDVNRHRELRWVIHLGDVQGGQVCTDELFQSRFDLFERFAAAFVFPPGDNDWFDCAEVRRGRYDEYERLSYIRDLFFPDPTRTTGGRHRAGTRRRTRPGDRSVHRMADRRDPPRDGSRHSVGAGGRGGVRGLPGAARSAMGPD